MRLVAHAMLETKTCQSHPYRYLVCLYTLAFGLNTSSILSEGSIKKPWAVGPVLHHYHLGPTFRNLIRCPLEFSDNMRNHRRNKWLGVTVLVRLVMLWPGGCLTPLYANAL